MFADLKFSILIISLEIHQKSEASVKHRLLLSAVLLSLSECISEVSTIDAHTPYSSKKKNTTLFPTKSTAFEVEVVILFCFSMYSLLFCFK